MDKNYTILILDNSDFVITNKVTMSEEDFKDRYDEFVSDLDVSEVKVSELYDILNSLESPITRIYPNNINNPIAPSDSGNITQGQVDSETSYSNLIDAIGRLESLESPFESVSNEVWLEFVDSLKDSYLSEGLSTNKLTSADLKLTKLERQFKKEIINLNNKIENVNHESIKEIGQIKKDLLVIFEKYTKDNLGY